MQFGLRHSDSQTLAWFADPLRSGDCTRHGLARELCDRTGWLNRGGEWCLSAAGKALPALAGGVGLALPPARDMPDSALAPGVPAGDAPDTRLSCSLEELGPVRLDPVGDADDRRLWEAMLAKHHPLGWARPPGGQMRYWIRSQAHGVLGGIGFRSATWQLRARDEWVGWSADARAANIGRVLCNHRFLLLPGVRATRWRLGVWAWPRSGRLPLTMAAPFAEDGTTLDRTERPSDGNPVVSVECPSNDVLRLRTCCRPATPCRRRRAEKSDYHAHRPETIADRFEDNLEWTTKLDLVSAWATEHDGLRLLEKRVKPGSKVRAIVGLWNYITEPKALEPDSYVVATINFLSSVMQIALGQPGAGETDRLPASTRRANSPECVQSPWPDGGSGPSN